MCGVIVMYNVTNSSTMFGVPLNTVQGTSVLSHVSDLFLVLIAFSLIWFILTIVVALFMVNKGRKKGQVLWVFIISIILWLILMFVAVGNLDHLLLWIGGM